MYKIMHNVLSTIINEWLNDRLSERTRVYIINVIGTYLRINIHRYTFDNNNRIGGGGICDIFDTPDPYAFPTKIYNSRGRRNPLRRPHAVPYRHHTPLYDTTYGESTQVIDATVVTALFTGDYRRLRALSIRIHPTLA